MYHHFNFGDVLAASKRASWEIEDVLPDGAALDFGRRFMPESLARTGACPGLAEDERRVLNQIRGHEYLSLFGLVEEFILPFVLDHARPQLSGDDHRVRALLQFASEEAKHIHLFKRFHARFTEGFGSPCEVIGPPGSIRAFVLDHDPLAVALLVLHLEWMTQAHYLGSVRDDGELDPLFKSLLKHHWIEEAQHAKLDVLMVEALADGLGPEAIDCAVDGYLDLVHFFDNGLMNQSGFNLEAFERATGRILGEPEQDKIKRQQHQALRWTYLGSGMTHPKFVATLSAIAPAVEARVAEAAAALC
jgi:P-aminobenzoate N-oxygenase AurF